MGISSRISRNLRKAVSPGAWVWVLPNLALGLFLMAMVALLWVLDRHEIDTRRNALARDLQWAEQTVRTRLAANQEYLQTLAKGIADGTTNRESFQEATTRYLTTHQELIQIVWVDADQVVRWVAPFENTAWNVGERLSTPEQAVAFQRALRTGVPAYSMPLVPPDESATLEINVSVVHDRISRGSVVGIYAADQVLRYLASSGFWEKYRVVMETEDRVISANSQVGLQTDLTELVGLDPPGQGLRLRVSSYAAESNLARDMLVLIIGGLMLLLAWSMWRLMAHTRRRLAAERERDRLFNLSLDLLCVLDLDGIVVRANPAFESVLGVSPALLHGTPLFDLVHPDDVSVTRAELQRIAHGAPSTGFENRCRSKEGNYRWLAWSANPVLEENRLYCVAHDVTDRRRAEDAIRTESAFRKAMEESVITGLRAVDMTGRITFVNPAFCELVGWSAEELIGSEPPFPYWPEEELDRLKETTRAWMSGHTPHAGFEIRIRRKTGERFFARMYVSPLVGADGAQTGWMASMVDITEQKRARSELEASRERFVAVLDGLDSAIHVADMATGETLFANEAFRAIGGGKVLERQPADRTGDDSDRATLTLRTLSPEDLPRELYDGEAQRDDRWYHIRERAIRWVDGRVVRMQTATEITDRKHADEMARKQQDRLQRTSKLVTMGEMASSLAHELNQPLAAIANYCAGCARRLASGDGRTEEILAALQKAGKQAERAGTIIRRMRDFVRKREPERAPVSVAEVVEEALGMAQIEARMAGVEIQLDIPRDLPMVFADKVMIEQVVLNLVKNGIESMEHTHPEQRRLRVSARAESGRTVEVAVTDHGHGVSPEDTDRLFVPFYTTKQQGMGMGLTICRSIVEFHDGRLTVAPNQNGGSIFTFTLPIER